MGHKWSSIPEPAVSRPSLLRGAGVAWVIGAGVLLWRAWVAGGDLPESMAWVWGVAVLVGLVKYRVAFRPVAVRNIVRIRELSPHKEKICLFAFQSLQSYGLVLLMIGFGMLLRYAGVSPVVLVVVYVAIGLGLLLGAGTYFRAAGR